MASEVRLALDVTATQRPRLTGWERFVLSLRDALDRRGDIEVVPLGWSRPSRGRWSTLAGQLWWYWRGGATAVQRSDPDLLHAPAFPPGRVDVPVVWTVHDSLILGQRRGFGRSGTRVWAPLARRALGRVAVVVTGTHSIAVELEELGVPAVQLRVVAPGTTELPEVGARPTNVRRLRDGLIVPVPSEFLLMVGTLEPRKRPGVAVAAAEQLGLPIVLAGRRDPSLDLTRLASWEHVYHASGIQDRELAWLYDHATAVLAPSAYEGFDLPVTEALSRGTRVVASRTPVHEEVGGSRCAYFELDHSGDAAESTRAALEGPPPSGADLPTWDDAAEAYSAIYREVGAPNSE